MKSKKSYLDHLPTAPDVQNVAQRRKWSESRFRQNAANVLAAVMSNLEGPKLETRLHFHQVIRHVMSNGACVPKCSDLSAEEISRGAQCASDIVEADNPGSQGENLNKTSGAATHEKNEVIGLTLLVFGLVILILGIIVIFVLSRIY